MIHYASTLENNVVDVVAFLGLKVFNCDSSYMVFYSRNAENQLLKIISIPNYNYGFRGLSTFAWTVT